MIAVSAAKTSAKVPDTGSSDQLVNTQTNVSETIRKAPLAEAQTALGKQNWYVLWNTGICPIIEILWKTASQRKISLKLDNRLQTYGRITIFSMAAVRHLEFKKKSYLVTWLSSSSKSAVVYQIPSKLDVISLRYSDLTI